MGSKSRLVNRLRQNDAFKAETAFLARHNLPFEVCSATGKGHPFLLIAAPDGAKIKFHVASSPKSYKSIDLGLANLRRKLAKFGIVAGAQ